MHTDVEIPRRSGTAREKDVKKGQTALYSPQKKSRDVNQDKKIKTQTEEEEE